jgi:cellulose synthase/poly-beta-1,6-N-acetylglucosamine synthase-like glycosyltransferase
MTEANTSDFGNNRPPVVNVIIPAYNTAQYISHALDSVFAQTFRDYEVIVVNDGSPDTPELEAVLAKYRNRISYLKQENLGPGGARNTGMRHARGRYLAFLDSDDVWLPDFLTELVQFLEGRPFVDMVCADCTYFGDPRWEGVSWQSLDPIQEPLTFEKLLPTLGGAFISFALLRRETASKVGYFDEDQRVLEDYIYWLRLLYSGGKLAYIRKILGRRRVHPGSLTYDQDVVPTHAAQALQKLVEHLPPSSTEAALVRRELAVVHSRYALREGRRRLKECDYIGARDWFTKANSAVPSKKVQFTILGLRWFPQWMRWAVTRWDRRSQS